MIHEVDPVEMRTRVPPVIHQRVRAAAEQSVRSMSAEIAHRLQKSFERDEMGRPSAP
jgi:Arc-like DNA binding domain